MIVCAVCSKGAVSMVSTPQAVHLHGAVALIFLWHLQSADMEN